uniref:Uncharacterized protein n=1 Tax=Triticum urartu TaxID=4572 RepID=A0A8R7Q5E2_TRIUA
MDRERRPHHGWGRSRRVPEFSTSRNPPPRPRAGLDREER